MSEFTFRVLPERERPRSVLSKTPAARLAQLEELYAPMVEQPDGTWRRDESCGVISKEQFMKLLDEIE